MMRSKRFLALLTALVMLFLPLSITTEAATGTPVGDFLVDGADFVFNAERGLLEITGSSPVTVSNQNPDAPTWHHIAVAPDVAANLTLAGVNINTSDMSGVPAISVPDSAVTVTVTLAEGTVNKLRSGDAATALQKLGTDGQLKITGSGTLNVTDGDEALSSIGAAPDSINAKVVIEGGSVFVNRLASQPVNASNTAVYRYVFKAAAYPNASVVSMNINGGQGFSPTGLRTDANGELSLFLPDGASVNTEVVLQVGEEQFAVQPGEYSWTAPLPVNVQGAPADAIPAKVQPNDYITIRVRPDEGTAVDSVTDYEQVGPDVWTGPYRDPVVINLAAAAIVPVTAIQLNSATEMDAGSSLVLDAYAMPENATNRAIQWSISDAGTTGATLDGATLYAPAGGTATVAATVLDGAGAGTPYTEYFTITVRSLFVPVTDIVLNSATEMDAGSSLILDAYAMPENATNRAIQWSISDAGTTGASLDGNTLYAPTGGTVTLAASVPDGSGAGTPYTEYFEITVRSLFVPVTDIVLNSAAEMDAGSSLVLDAYAMPENATNRAIQWSISDAGTTGASLDGNTLYAPTGGTVTLAASVPDGS
ncbi:MAG TPA: hypothetical protein GXZ64_06470, partial [Clostridiaceae bacterium]|nr:hypothetical protein [Clostridiaceae bacterium]